jgi:integrase
MSLFKKPGSDYWWMDIYRGAGRKRIKRSTRTKDLSEARIIEQGFMRVNRGETTREKMVQLLDAILGPEEKGLPIEEIGQFYLSCVEDEKRKLGAKTLKTRVNLAGRFAEWARRESRVTTANDVTVAVAWQFSEYIGKQADVTNKTRNAYMSELGTVWQMLIKRSRAKENPWAIPRVQRDRDQEQTGRAFTREEEQRIFDAAAKVGHEWFEMCVIARYTGLRMTDVKGLKWSQVDLKNRRLVVKPVKTARHGIEVGLPMHPKLAAVLAERAGRGVGTDGRSGAPEPQPKDGSIYVLPERARHDGKKYFKGDMPFSKILKLAKVTDDGDGKYKLSFHCWRHTFATRLSEAGIDKDTRMALGGWTVGETERIYNHDWASLKNAIDAME